MLYKKNGLTNESVLKAYEAHKKKIIEAKRSRYDWLAGAGDEAIWWLHETAEENWRDGGDFASYIKKVREVFPYPSNAPALD